MNPTNTATPPEPTSIQGAIIGLITTLTEVLKYWCLGSGMSAANARWELEEMKDRSEIEDRKQRALATKARGY